jgi:hypothetical protein
MGADVPLISELAKTDLDRLALDVIISGVVQGRPLAAPPAVPFERVEALRAAFDATMKDAVFLADASKRNLDINPLSGTELQAFVTEIARSPTEVINRVNDLTYPKDAQQLGKR